MPIYEYQCEKCHHEFEREQRITEDPVKTCPKCKARRVKKLISQTSFVLKGGGWYSDLYASNKGKDDADKPAAEASSSDKDGATAKSDGDTKSAAGDAKDTKAASSDGKDTKPGPKGGSKGKGKKAGKKAAA